MHLQIALSKDAISICRIMRYGPSPCRIVSRVCRWWTTWTRPRTSLSSSVTCHNKVESLWHSKAERPLPAQGFGNFIRILHFQRRSYIWQCLFAVFQAMK